MSSENYKNPNDYEIPENYRPIAPGVLYQAAQSPELRPMIRYFSEQVQDALSYYLKEGDSDAEKAFLIQCRKDSRAFRKVLQQKILAAAERYKDDKRVDFILENLACTNRSSSDEEGAGYLFSVEIRPLYFSSMLSDEEKEGKRYPLMENRYTVFLHLDKNHRYQTTRFAEPEEATSPFYKNIMASLLGVFSSEDFIKPLLEQHYGDWEFLAEKIVEEMIGNLWK